MVGLRTKRLQTGVRRYQQRSAPTAFERGVVPLRAFMQKNVREKDLKLFTDLSREERRRAGGHVAADPGAL